MESGWADGAGFGERLEVEEVAKVAKREVFISLSCHYLLSFGEERIPSNP